MTDENTTAKWMDIYNKLSEPLPREAIRKVDEYRGLVGFNTQYVVERLNEVFGILGWSHDVEKDSNGDRKYHRVKVPYIMDKKTGELGEKEFIICEAELSILNPETGEPIKKIHTTGGMAIIRGDIDDAYKGAKTEALCKAASYIGVGAEAYKGLLKVEGSQSAEEKEGAGRPRQASQKQKELIKNMMNWKDVPEELATKVTSFLSRPSNAVQGMKEAADIIDALSACPKKVKSTAESSDNETTKLNVKSLELTAGLKDWTGQDETFNKFQKFLKGQIHQSSKIEAWRDYLLKLPDLPGKE
jgi:transposase